MQDYYSFMKHLNSQGSSPGSSQIGTNFASALGGFGSGGAAAFPGMGLIAGMLADIFPAARASKYGAGPGLVSHITTPLHSDHTGNGLGYFGLTGGPDDDFSGGFLGGSTGLPSLFGIV